MCTGQGEVSIQRLYLTPELRLIVGRRALSLTLQLSGTLGVTVNEAFNDMVNNPLTSCEIPAFMLVEDGEVY